MRCNIPTHNFFLNFVVLTLLAMVPIGLQAQINDAMLSFKGFELGTHFDSLTLEQHNSLLKRGKYQKLIRYDLLEDHLKLKEMKLRFVRLYFWQGYLHSVDVKSASGSGDDLRDWVKNTHGEGFQEDAMGYKYLWEYSDCRIFLEQNLVTKDVTITFLNDDVHNKYYKFMYERSYGN